MRRALPYAAARHGRRCQPLQRQRDSQHPQQDQADGSAGTRGVNHADSVGRAAKGRFALRQKTVG